MRKTRHRSFLLFISGVSLFGWLLWLDLMQTLSKDTDETNYDINYEGNDDIDSNGEADSNYNGMVSVQFSDTSIGYEDIGQYCDIPGQNDANGLPW